VPANEVSINGSSLNLVIGSFCVIVSDVPGNGVIEENGFLADNAKGSAKMLQIVVFDVDTLKENVSFGGTVETLEQGCHGRFSASGFANQHELLSFLHAQTKAVESHVVPAFILKTNVSKLNIPSDFLLQ
jgi:hypothetical protein